MNFAYACSASLFVSGTYLSLTFFDFNSWRSRKQFANFLLKNFAFQLTIVVLVYIDAVAGIIVDLESLCKWNKKSGKLEVINAVRKRTSERKKKEKKGGGERGRE